MRNKATLTKQLIELLPDDQKISVDSAIPLWWYNLRKNGGMRLTSAGHMAFVNQFELEHYSYRIDDPVSFTQHTILKLDRKMQMPYYIHAVKGVPKEIIFFGSKEAVMINLYGNLQQFLDNYCP